MSAEILLVLMLLAPAVTAALLPLFHARPNLREGTTIAGAVILFSAALGLLGRVADGERPELHLVTVVPGLDIAFRLEPLGMLFATVASGLWIVNSVYSIGYMRSHDEPRQTLFYVCFAIALAATMGIALSANLFTLFLFYEMLTLSTYPLVVHGRDEEARRAGRLYLGMLLGSSILFFLPAIAWTGVLAGTLDFRAGGILGGAAPPALLAVLLGLYAFGIGKAAIMPMHGWLPAAMVAPTPVSALLHAVAVVKAGVFTVLKIVVYIFGVDTLAESGASQWLVYVAGFTVVAASLIALGKDNLKARLAYSTVSQLSYVVMGAALATTAGILGGGMQVAMHAFGKITLFFCAGAIYIAAHKTKVSQLDGLGRRMPVTMAAFFVGALCVSGIPLFGGFWVKWHLLSGAEAAGSIFAMAVLMVSAVLNLAYLLPPAVRAFLLPPKDGEEEGIREAPLACLVPILVTAAGCVVLFFCAGPVARLVGGIVD